MALIKDTDTYLQYRYTVSEFKAMIGFEVIEFDPGKIRDISIEKNFEEDFFPLLKVVVITNETTYRHILQNKNTAKFKFRLQQYSRLFHDPNTESMKKDAINQTFVIFTDDDTPDMSEKVTDLKTKTDDIEGQSLMQDDYEAEFYLFREDYIQNTKKLCHGLLTRCNMETAVAWLCGKVGIDKLLLSPMDNRQTYAPVVIPQDTFINCLNFLDNWYGFYKNGAIKFFDFDCMYLLNYTAKTTTWRPGEVTEGVIFVLDEIVSEEQYSLQLKRENDPKHYITTGHNFVEINGTTSVQDVISGSNIDVINSQTSSVSHTSGGGSNTKVYRSTNKNPYDSTTYAAMAKANSCVITCGLGSVDLSIISPNKKFQFVFEDTSLNSKYGGWYKMSQSQISFQKEGDFFTIAVAGTFKCFKDL